MIWVAILIALVIVVIRKSHEYRIANAAMTLFVGGILVSLISVFFTAARVGYHWENVDTEYVVGYATLKIVGDENSYVFKTDRTNYVIPTDEIVIEYGTPPRYVINQPEADTLGLLFSVYPSGFSVDHLYITNETFLIEPLTTPGR
jgi:hypothetical protein